MSIGLVFLRLVLVQQPVNIGLQDLVKSIDLAVALLPGLSASLRIALTGSGSVVILLHYDRRDWRIATWAMRKGKLVSGAGEMDGVPGDRVEFLQTKELQAEHVQ